MLFSLPLERYVVKLGGEVSVGEDGLRSDDAWWMASSERRSVTTLAGAGSLAVLGEPGVGTTIMQSIASGDGVDYVPLGEVPDVATLRDRLNAAVSAASGAARRTLVLDGVDECQIPMKALTRQIIDAVTGLSGVRVVIGCRAGDWPTSLGEKLRESLGELAPVRRTHRVWGQ